MQYAVWIVSPPGYAHSAAFEHVAAALSGAFAELGHDAPVTRYPCEGARNIILGGNLLRAGDAVPPDSVIWNLEQIAPGSPWLTEAYVGWLRRCEVWDYSPANIAALAGMGIGARLCEVGYHECLERIPAAPEQDIDVLHYGSMNERRAGILHGLRQAGLRVHHAFGCYGAELDALIARSKVVVNIHYYPAKVFEIVRCSYLLANRKCVVSEAGGGHWLGDTDALYFVPYDDLVKMCEVAVLDAAIWRHRGERGYEVFKQRRQADFLRGLV